MIKRYLCNDESLKAYRRQLRNYGTYAEAVLWPFLKNRQIEGALFRRQFSVGPFIMDFYCPEVRLCVELDGHHHFTPEGIAYDERRTAYLVKNHRIKVMRFENQAVFDHTEDVLLEISEMIRSLRDSR